MKKKKTEKEFVRYIKKVIERYTPVLFLEKYHVQLIKGISIQGSLFEVQFRYPYLDFLLRWSDTAFEQWKKGDDLNREILHEMCHVVTDPFYAKACTRYVGKVDLEDERERLTDMICNIIMRLSAPSDPR